jgi:hypothetical protein
MSFLYSRVDGSGAFCGNVERPKISARRILLLEYLVGSFAEKVAKNIRHIARTHGEARSKSTRSVIVPHPAAQCFHASIVTSPFCDLLIVRHFAEPAARFWFSLSFLSVFSKWRPACIVFSRRSWKGERR